MTHSSTIQYVIGLGNPEPKYERTPHNIGRNLMNWICRARSSDWRNTKHFEWTDTQPKFVRLHSYMNLSGQAVAALLQKFNAAPSEILVCVDDFDLPLGKIRIRKKGSAGTHNGLKSIIEVLQTQDFARLRMGVGPLPEHQDAGDYVLRPFHKSQDGAIEKMLQYSSDAIQAIVEQGLDHAMNQYNGS